MNFKSTSVSLPNQTTSRNDWYQRVFMILFSNMACLFDFVIFVHLDKVLSSVFFPTGSSAFVAQLQSLALFSLGFLSRPIGALLIGRYGDIHGRIPALSISLAIFTITTLFMACLPTYAQVGIVAPILFIILRLIQGMAFGAQIPLGWVFAAEHAPRNKFAIYSSLVTASFALGNILSFGTAILLSNMFTQDMMVSHGWRISFIIGGVLSIIALILKRNISEKVQLSEGQKQPEQPSEFSNIMPIFRRRQAIVLTGVLSFTLVSLATLIIMMPKLIAARFNLDNTFLVVAYLIFSIFAMIGLVFYGWLADKYPIGKVMIGGAIALILHTLIFYIFLTSNSLYYILPMCAFLGFLSGVRGLPAVIFVQLFPPEVRLTSVAVIYNCVAALVGLVLPLALLYTTAIISSAPGLFITFVGVVIIMTGSMVQSSPGLNKFENLVDSNHDGTSA